MLLQYQICICSSGRSKFDMDSNLFLQNCFCIILLIIMFIRIFDIQYWKRNNICNTWKIKKGKTKNLNVVYLLKHINVLCNSNFYFKITWPPSPTKLSPPHQNKKSLPPLAKNFLKFLTPTSSPKLKGGGGVHAMKSSLFLKHSQWE